MAGIFFVNASKYAILLTASNGKRRFDEDHSKLLNDRPLVNHSEMTVSTRRRQEKTSKDFTSYFRKAQK